MIRLRCSSGPPTPEQTERARPGVSDESRISELALLVGLLPDECLVTSAFEIQRKYAATITATGCGSAAWVAGGERSQRWWRNTSNVGGSATATWPVGRRDADDIITNAVGHFAIKRKYLACKPPRFGMVSSCES